MPLPANAVHGGQVGDNWSPEAEHEPRQAGLAGPNPDGDGGEAQHDSVELSWDDTLKLADIRARFESRTAARLRRSTQVEYWECFARFAIFARIERMTKARLNGREGRDSLLAFASKVPPTSIGTVMAGVKKVWRKGLDLNWPLERDDLPRAATPDPTPAPRRTDIEPWASSARNERDPYERSWFLVELNHGFRPSNQQAGLKRGHLVFNEATGRPLGFVAGGRAAQFKTSSPVMAALTPEESGALAEWLKNHPDASPDAYLWPWRNAKGQVPDGKKKASPKTINGMRRGFAKRWKLKWLTSKAMRKFVKTALIDAGMPEPLKSYWQGHKPSLSNMDFVYGTRPWEETLALQLSYLPDGPIGLFATVGPAGSGGIPPELERLYAKLKAKEIDAQDFARKAKELAWGSTPELAKP